jgi:hypothetical protein
MKAMQKNNTSGVTGVHWHRDGGWVAKIHHKGKMIYLGLHYEFDDAVKARQKAEEELRI